MPTPHKILNSDDASNPATSPIVERDDQDMAVRPHQGKRDNQHVPIQRPDNQEESIIQFLFFCRRYPSANTTDTCKSQQCML